MKYSNECMTDVIQCILGNLHFKDTSHNGIYMILFLLPLTQFLRANHSKTTHLMKLSFAFVFYITKNIYLQTVKKEAMIGKSSELLLKDMKTYLRYKFIFSHRSYSS